MPEDGSQPVRTGTRYNILVPTKEHKLCKCDPFRFLFTSWLHFLKRSSCSVILAHESLVSTTVSNGSQPVRTGMCYSILGPTKEHKLCKCDPFLCSLQNLMKRFSPIRMRNRKTTFLKGVFQQPGPFFAHLKLSQLSEL